MSSAQNANRTLAAACFIFFSLGLATASIGPLLSEFAVNTRATLAAVGAIFTAFSLGALISQILSGLISSRFGLIPLLIAGALQAAVGLVGMSLSRTLPLLLGMALVTGFGHGAINLCGNLSIATLFKDNRVTAVNFLNIFYAFGAFAGPALVGIASARLKSGISVFWLGAFLIFASALLMMRLSPKRAAAAEVRSSAPVQKIPLYSDPILWALALAVLIYCGSEIGMAGWATTYMQQTVNLPLEKAAFVTSGFYLALTLGRILCSWLGSKLSDVQVLITTLSTAFLGAILFMIGYQNTVLSVMGVLLIGLGYGGAYPTLVALTTSVFHQTAGKAVSLVIAMGSVGGMVIPALQGVIIDQRGPRLNSVLIALLAALMLLLVVFIRWQLNRRQSGLSQS